uniref:carbonyl reductase (NADPH) n=1 Tax=Schistocephalus solidus TaxID=70667 RepID=A0A0X3Q252_SCHSO
MKLAIVTGANKGIGHGIVECLVKCLTPQSDWHVYLTARNVSLGNAAIEGFAKQGLPVKFHQLDITDKASRNKLADYVKSNYPNGINILVNNAGIAYTNDSAVSLSEQAETTLATNYFATVEMCNTFLPWMAKNSRLVNVSSTLSVVALKDLGDDLYEKFVKQMTMDQLNDLMRDFVNQAKSGDLASAGWPQTAYGVSKLGLTKATFILAEQLKDDPRKILINACCPGYVDTDMTNHKGTKTIQEGAETPVYLATLPEGTTEPYGQLIRDCKPLSWTK